METKNQVILLHGLSRTSRSMRPMKKALQKMGYPVLSLDYPSRMATIEELAKYVLGELRKHFTATDIVRLNFVTHSMGGIILRQIMNADPLPNLGRVVMLSPPNQGSELVDKLRRFGILRINGPACMQLSASPDSFVRNLGEVTFELGVITGNKPLNFILSMLLPGPDDGKVTVESAKVEGMRDFLVVPCTHSFIMRNSNVQEAVNKFFVNGSF